MKKSLLKSKLVVFAIYVFVIWRLALFLIGLGAMRVLPFKPSFPYHDAILSLLSSKQFIWHWANFDGPHYITIAEKGYVGTGLIQAFFPLYPLLLRLVNKIVGNFLFSGLILSNLCFLLSLIFFLKLIRLEKIRNRGLALLFLLLFPTSFYFGALYSESLFFLVSILSFLFMFKKKWVKAGVFASLASATRLVGVFIMPALLWEYYQQNKGKSAAFWFKALFLGLLSISGFLIFCFYLKKNFGDYFYFVKVQSAFGASRQTDKLILFHQVAWRYIKMVVTMKKSDILFFTILQEFILSLLVLGGLIWGWFKKKIKESYLIYSFLSFFLPTLTGHLSSMPRYVSLIFPIYLLFSEVKDKKVKFLILIFSSLLLIINTALFVRGFWIA